jgi:hypothetical protein
MNLFFDSVADDARRRRALYEGSVFVYSSSPAIMSFVEFARELIEATFWPCDPRMVHQSLPVEQCVEHLAKLKPNFIHHSKSKEFIQRILAERGCDLEATYFDVPRLRTAFPSEYLSSGIAYAFHPHRDTWYSAPFSQINWWLPVYEITPDNGMAFHPQFWDRDVPNSSNTYNYYEWNRTSRQNAARYVKTDTRIQPRPQISLEPHLQLRLVVNVGGSMIFSAAQLHSTVPNTCGVTRFSIDFRTVNLDDLHNRHGATNIDSACTGTTLRDYIRASDFTRIPEDVVALYFDGTEVDFTPSPSETSSAHAPCVVPQRK